MGCLGIECDLSTIWSGELTDYAADYAGVPPMRTGRQGFGLWQECIQDYQPGDEYDLVDEFAALLKMANFYEWQPDEALPPEDGGGSSNPDLLQSKGAVPECPLCDFSPYAILSPNEFSLGNGRS